MRDRPDPEDKRQWDQLHSNAVEMTEALARDLDWETAGYLVCLQNSQRSPLVKRLIRLHRESKLVDLPTLRRPYIQERGNQQPGNQEPYQLSARKTPLPADPNRSLDIFHALVFGQQTTTTGTTDHKPVAEIWPEESRLPLSAVKVLGRTPDNQLREKLAEVVSAQADANVQEAEKAKAEAVRVSQSEAIGGRFVPCSAGLRDQFNSVGTRVLGACEWSGKSIEVEDFGKIGKKEGKEEVLVSSVKREDGFGIVRFRAPGVASAEAPIGERETLGFFYVKVSQNQYILDRESDSERVSESNGDAINNGNAIMVTKVDWTRPVLGEKWIDSRLDRSLVQTIVSRSNGPTQLSLLRHNDGPYSKTFNNLLARS
jgi:hypothetical protein